MTITTWVFGYGSLVSPESLASTIGRPIGPDAVAVSELRCYGRRWNYGSLHLRGDWHHDDVHVRQGLVVSLGLVEAADEVCNGVAVRINDEELAALDWRERDYERTDVTEQINGERLPADARVVTYVPRASAVDRYLTARDQRRAGIRLSYWNLVADAFVQLGGDHSAMYETTPAPDVPVVDMTLSILS